jgi:hypothetical protein
LVPVQPSPCSTGTTTPAADAPGHGGRGEPRPAAADTSSAMSVVRGSLISLYCH